MPLAAEDLNEVFLKHFLPETVYLVPGENQHSVSSELAAEQTHAEASLPATPAVEVPHAVAAPASPPAASEKFNFIGENRKGVIVLVSLPDVTFRALPQSDFLTKILAAIGLGANDVAFVNNISGAIAQFEELVQLVEVNYIISFASRIDTQLPHAKFTLYNPVVVDQVPIIFSQSLAVLDKDPEQKKLLWNALRQVFL